MTTDKVVYRTRDRSVRAVIDNFEAEQRAWREKARDLLAELGFAGRNWVVTHHPDGMRIVGVEVRPGDRTKPPDGWRVATYNRPVLVPDKRRSAGKQAATQIKNCQPPKHPRVRLPGMPGIWLDPSSSRAYYANLNDHGDGHIYVDWSTQVPEITPDQRGRVSGVDLTIWERVRLSQYYALLEANDAERQAAS